MGKVKYRTSEDFISRVKEKNDFNWSFEKTVFESLKSKVVVTCPTHGDKEVIAGNILHQNTGCNECVRKADTNSVIKTKYQSRLIDKFGDIYTFNNFRKNSSGYNRVDVICSEHGITEDLNISSLLHRANFCCSGCRVSKRNESDIHERLKLLKINLKIKFKGHISVVDETFVNKSTDAKFTCVIHGEFTAKPNNVTSSKNGCVQCYTGFKPVSNNGLRFTTESYVEACKGVHGDRYDYSRVEFKGMNKKVEIVCREHGAFKTEAWVHLKGHQCNKCSLVQFGLKTRIWDTRHFIKKATEVHGNKYDYSETICETRSDSVIIKCREHGYFQQLVCNHIAGKQGCKECLDITRGNLYFENYDDCYLYLMRITGNGEDFLKVGISIDPSKRRHEIHSDVNNAYKVEVLRQVYDYSRRVWLFEKRLHESDRYSKYIPEIWFGGITECYNISELETFTYFFDKFKGSIGNGKENTKF